MSGYNKANMLPSLQQERYVELAYTGLFYVHKLRLIYIQACRSTMHNLYNDVDDLRIIKK